MSEPTSPDGRAPAGAADGSAHARPGSAPQEDPLAGVLAELDTIGETPLTERPAAFERLHAALADALNMAVEPSRDEPH